MPAELVTAVLAFLDTDAVYGPDHPCTHAAKAALRAATSTTVHEDNAVDIERVPLHVFDGSLGAAS